MQFLKVLRRIYVNALFLEALKEAPAHMKFLRKILSKKGKLEGSWWSLLERLQCNTPKQVVIQAAGSE